MKKELIYTMSSPYRDDFRIYGYSFGEGYPSLAIVGPMRGDEIEQQFICARIVSLLSELEERGELTPGHKILVIPSCNPFSMNVSQRFWTMDKTDINRMYPGYSEGETTQRIADAVFSAINSFEYGIQLASFYMPGDFIPHVRMISTGYEAIDEAKLFGLPFVAIRQPRPFDTALLNYNWQIWGTKAFSLYAGQTQRFDSHKRDTVIESILRFLHAKDLTTRKPLRSGYASSIIRETDVVNLKSTAAGLFNRFKGAGDLVRKGETIAQILHPYEGSVLSEIKAEIDGQIFFSHNKPLVLENSVIYRIFSSGV